MTSDRLRTDVALLLGVSERTALRFMKAADGITSFGLGPRHLCTTGRDVGDFIGQQWEKSKAGVVRDGVDCCNLPFLSFRYVPMTNEQLFEQILEAATQTMSVAYFRPESETYMMFYLPNRSRSGRTALLVVDDDGIAIHFDVGDQIEKRKTVIVDMNDPAEPIRSLRIINQYVRSEP